MGADQDKPEPHAPAAPAAPDAEPATPIVAPVVAPGLAIPIVDADAEHAEITEAVGVALDTDKTLPPTVAPVITGPNPSRTQPLPAQPGPAAVSTTPTAAAPSGASLRLTMSRALKKPIAWVFLFMLAVLIAALLS